MMGSQRGSCVYAPLDRNKRQIRLLHLLPPLPTQRSLLDRCLDQLREPFQTSDTATIRCVFSVVSLDDHPKFEALSYVWGSPAKDAIVELEGCPKQITSNLYCALKHLRHSGEERVIWADALCIDQDNSEERSQQVSLMHHVYAQASAVVIFLSKAWEGVDALFRLFRFAHANPDHHYDVRSEPTLASFGIDPLSLDMHGALFRFCRLPWWTRVWTVQEYALARQRVLQCGHRSIDGATWQGFTHSLRNHAKCCLSQTYFKGVEHGVPNIGNDLERIRNFEIVLSPAERQKRSLLYIASLLKSQRCLHPSDKVYGLLGLAEGQSQTTLLPNYSHPPGRVYTDVAMAALKDTQSLDFLSFVYGNRYIRNPDIEDFPVPTFVPDFTAIVNSKWWASVTLGRCNAIHIYNASLGALADFVLSDESEALTSALIIDSIADMGGLFDVAPLNTILQECESLARMYDDRGPYVNRREAFQRALCGGVRRLSTDVWERVGAELPAIYETWRRWQINESTAASGQSQDLAENFKDAFCTTRAGRRFAVTDTGYIGFIPTSSRRGDVIALMPGGKVPYVLRSLAPVNVTHPTGKLPRYRFVGDAYVQGLMHGEAWSHTRLDTIVLI